MMLTLHSTLNESNRMRDMSDWILKTNVYEKSLLYISRDRGTDCTVNEGRTVIQ